MAEPGVHFGPRLTEHRGGREPSPNSADYKFHGGMNQGRAILGVGGVGMRGEVEAGYGTRLKVLPLNHFDERLHSRKNRSQVAAGFFFWSIPVNGCRFCF